MEVKMTDLYEKHILNQLSRNSVTKLLQYDGVAMEDNFTGKLEAEGSVYTIKVNHYGKIVLEEENLEINLIDFLDRFFMQKRSIIINHILKCLGIEKPEIGLS